MNRIRPASVRLVLRATLVGPLLLTAACLGYPQRIPGPLFLPEDGAPRVSPPASGSALVTLQRGSDPVWVRRAGARDDYALAFHKKRERVATGSLVRTGAGGRAELLWSPDASSVLLFDEARVTLGDPLRDEPLVVFHSVTHALVTATPEDRFELPGGAILRGDPAEPTGPILIEQDSPEILRVVNQAKRTLRVRYRDQDLDVVPGDSIDLPCLRPGPAAAAPVVPGPEGTRHELAGAVVLAQGRLSVQGNALVASEPARVASGGVEVRLAPGDAASFSGLSQVPPAPRADSSESPE